MTSALKLGSKLVIVPNVNHPIWFFWFVIVSHNPLTKEPLHLHKLLPYASTYAEPTYITCNNNSVWTLFPLPLCCPTHYPISSPFQKSWNQKNLPLLSCCPTICLPWDDFVTSLLPKDKILPFHLTSTPNSIWTCFLPSSTSPYPLILELVRRRRDSLFFDIRDNLHQGIWGALGGQLTVEVQRGVVLHMMIV